jgi:hypothetical protein
MDNTHYISTELLSLEILQEIVLHHNYWRYQKQKLIFKSEYLDKMALQSSLFME